MLLKQVLGIETSCDDTSVAVVSDTGLVRAVVQANQDIFHRPFGGVVPEIAGRNHTHQLLPLIDEVLEKCKIALDDVDGIAVTNRPGLIGSLLVGVITAKSLGLALAKPFLGVNHLEGHLLAPFLKDQDYAPPKDFSYPYLALAVSGGHTSLYQVEDLGRYLLLGHTIDDAAGEAFDKFAKFVGLGFPGGIKVDRFSQNGDPEKYRFPRALSKEETYNFSFSGLKTSAQRVFESLTVDEQVLADLCASYQEAICEALLIKLNRAVELTGLNRAIITGGVSANSRLRALGKEWADKKGVQLVVPPLRYCTDNAAMIAYVGILRMNRGEFSDYHLSPSPIPAATDIIKLG